MKNKFLKLFILSLISLIPLNNKPGSIKLQNRVENIGRFTATFKLYADNFSDDIKLIEFKIEKIPQDILDLVDSMKNLSVEEKIKKVKSGELNLFDQLQSRGLAKKIEKSNIINIYRKGIEDTTPRLTWVPIKKDSKGKMYIEIANVKWQEDIKIPLENRYFKTDTKKITAIEVNFDDEQGKAHVLQKTDPKGWSDKCFKVIDYPKEVVDKGDIAEAHVRLTDC